MKYVLKTTYPCLVKAKNEECELDENDMLEIEDEDTLLIYPEDASSLPFYINLNCPKESQFLSIFPQDNHTLLLLEQLQRLKIVHKQNLSFAGKNCEVAVCGQKIWFDFNNTRVEYFCPHPCKEYNIFKLKDFACIQFEEDLYSFSTKHNKLTHFCGNAEINGDFLTLTKSFNDSAGRQRNAKYKFEEDITVEEENFTHNASTGKSQLVPYQLMESVKAKDYEFALSLLSENLKSQIDSAQIREFFGNFSSFLPLSTTEFITISGKNKNYVKFSLRENLIDDITVDAL